MGSGRLPDSKTYRGRLFESVNRSGFTTKHQVYMESVGEGYGSQGDSVTVTLPHALTHGEMSDGFEAGSLLPSCQG